MVSIYNGILFNHKREWSSDNATTCMSLVNIILSEIGQILYDSTYVSYIKQIPRNKGIRGYLELRRGNRELLLKS